MLERRFGKVVERIPVVSWGDMKGEEDDVEEFRFDFRESEQGMRRWFTELVSAETDLEYKDAEVRSRLTHLVNSGKYNIFAISTFYVHIPPDSPARMVKALVYYTDSRGAGNQLRVDNVFGSGVDLKSIQRSCEQKIAWLRGRYDKLLAVDVTENRSYMLMVAAMVYHAA